MCLFMLSTIILAMNCINVCVIIHNNPDNETQLFVLCENIIMKKYHFTVNLVITRSSGGIFWDRGISEARNRFCRQVFFFNLVYIF